MTSLQSWRKGTQIALITDKILRFRDGQTQGIINSQYVKIIFKTGVLHIYMASEYLLIFCLEQQSINISSVENFNSIEKKLNNVSINKRKQKLKHKMFYGVIHIPRQLNHFINQFRIKISKVITHSIFPTTTGLRCYIYLQHCDMKLIIGIKHFLKQEVLLLIKKC